MIFLWLIFFYEPGQMLLDFAITLQLIERIGLFYGRDNG